MKKNPREVFIVKMNGLISRRKVLLIGLTGTFLGLGKKAGWARIKSGDGHGEMNSKEMNAVQIRCAGILRRYGGELGSVSSTGKEK